MADEDTNEALEQELTALAVEGEALSEDAQLAKLVEQAATDYAELIVSELSAKRWEELEALEFPENGGTLYFSETLQRRRANGKFEEIKIKLRVPLLPEIRAARKEAHELAKQDGIDPKRDVDLFNDLDNACILWRAIRSDTAPFEPWAMDVRDLEKRLDKPCLMMAWGKLEGYRRVIDPRPIGLNRAQLLGLVAAIAEGRNISPLLVIDSPAQAAFVIFMASLLRSFLTSKSLWPLSGTSTPEPSPSESSTH
jgi:hypothetical protein